VDDSEAQEERRSFFELSTRLLRLPRSDIKGSDARACEIRNGAEERAKDRYAKARLGKSDGRR
jgi:hypothetical protein